MMELSEISVETSWCWRTTQRAEPVVVGKVGTRCVYATNYEGGYVVVAAPERFSRPHRVRGVNDE